MQRHDKLTNLNTQFGGTTILTKIAEPIRTAGTGNELEKESQRVASRNQESKRESIIWNSTSILHGGERKVEYDREHRESAFRAPGSCALWEASALTLV